MWLGWSAIRVAGCSLLHGYQEQNDQCGNSAEESQASDDGYINVRNLLSTQEVK